MPKLPNYADSIMGVQKQVAAQKGFTPAQQLYTCEELYMPKWATGLYYVISWKMMTKFQM